MDKNSGLGPRELIARTVALRGAETSDNVRARILEFREAVG